VIDINVLKPDAENPNILVGCVGYEKRSIFHLASVAESTSITLFDYQAEGVLSYNANIKAAKAKRARLHKTMQSLLDDVLEQATALGGAYVEVDITSLDRGKLAWILGNFFKNSERFRRVRLVYYPRTFVPPRYEFDVVNSFGPVVPELTGNVPLSRDELAVIVGAGYEFGRVVGALDTLEPGNVICFAPRGNDSRYDGAVLRANLDFAFLGKDGALIWYALNDPFALYYNLRRIVEHEAAIGNVLILPLGPKLFAAISLLIAFALHPKVSVWRHSTASTDRPSSISDAVASGERLAFEFNFRRA